MNLGVNNNSFILGIEASRNRSGGAKTHLLGILNNFDPQKFGIKRVHLWAYRSLADSIPNFPWLEKHCPKVLERSLLRQVLWQRFCLAKEVRQARCDVLLNTDAGSLCTFSPAATISQDMLSYEPGEMSRYGLSLGRLRLLILRYVQAWSLKRAEGAVFLTQHAARVIQQFTGPLRHVEIIPHGVSEEFRFDWAKRAWPTSDDQPIRCVYVSNTEPYKHQWHVVTAIGKLRQAGRNLSLTLIGGGSGPAQLRLLSAMARWDQERQFVEQIDYVEHEIIPRYLAKADLFIFASSCENMPNTLVEAMAAGLPIACSDRGPMPEVLQDGGVYFNPEDPNSIGAAIIKLLDNSGLRQNVARRANELAASYSWKRCANETFSFVVKCARSRL